MNVPADNAPAVDVAQYRLLALKLARRFHAPWLDPEDLEQEAFAALCIAAETFDPSRSKFITWATYTVTNHLRAAVADNVRSSRFGSVSQHRCVMSRLRKALDRGEVTPETARQFLLSGWGGWGESLTDEQARRACDFALHPEARLDAPTRQTNAADPVRLLVETLTDEEAVPDASHAALMVAWSRILETLPMNGRERELRDRRLLADEPELFADIGARWGVTKQRVQQIEGGRIERIRDAAVAAGLREAA